MALKKNADKTFYLAYDLLPKDNPAFHHEDHYSFDMVEGQNKLRTPQINNITLKVRLERKILKCTGKLIVIFFQLPPSPLLSQGENIEFCDETTVAHLDCAGKHSKALIFKGSPCWHFSFYDLLTIFFR